MTTLTAIPRTVPSRQYRKTHQMRETERLVNARMGIHSTDDPDWVEIHDIVLDALRTCANDRVAANSIDQLPSTFSHWISRLGLDAEAEMIRKARA